LGFTVMDPARERCRIAAGVHSALIGLEGSFLNRDDRSSTDWRKQIELVNAQKSGSAGPRVLYPPHVWRPTAGSLPRRKMNTKAMELWYGRCVPKIVRRLPNAGGCLPRRSGPDYPERAFARIQQQFAAKSRESRADVTTPTRPGRYRLEFKPATSRNTHAARSWRHLPGRTGSILHCRLPFRPTDGRAGASEDVVCDCGIDGLRRIRRWFCKSNARAAHYRVQAGGYARESVTGRPATDARSRARSPEVTFRLGPGSGASVVLRAPVREAPTMHVPDRS